MHAQHYYGQKQTVSNLVMVKFKDSQGQFLGVAICVAGVSVKYYSVITYLPITSIKGQAYRGYLHIPHAQRGTINLLMLVYMYVVYKLMLFFGSS